MELSPSAENLSAFAILSVLALGLWSSGRNLWLLPLLGMGGVGAFSFLLFGGTSIKPSVAPVARPSMGIPVESTPPAPLTPIPVKSAPLTPPVPLPPAP